MLAPLTGLVPLSKLALEASVRTGGATGKVGSFGWTRAYEDGSPKAHKGVDFLAEPGAPVFAPVEARVIRVGEQLHGQGYGQRLYLSANQDNNLVMVYAHLAVQFVKRGDFVRAGHCLGLVGRSGNISSGDPTHLHFETRYKETHVDPLAVLCGLAGACDIDGKPVETEGSALIGSSDTIA